MNQYEVRSGRYYDSVVLMQLQRSLVDLPGVDDAGVVMGTEANRALLRAAGFDLAGVTASAEDMVLAVRGDDEAALVAALAAVDDLLARQRAAGGSTAAYQPRSLAAAARMAPDSRWVLISVPGRYAAGVAEEALGLGRHVFLYSDNVAAADEIRLKRQAAADGLLVMGPDCGTAIIDGIGFGFANRVRRGRIGVVAASGTGLQAVTAGIHNRGAGVSQAFGTGGRDLKAEVGGTTARQALGWLAADPETDVIVLVSKPPDTSVASRLLSVAAAGGKPVVVYFIGYAPPARRLGNLHFAACSEDAAALAVALSAAPSAEAGAAGVALQPFAGFVRGLFSGGTLAVEMLLGLQALVAPLRSNVPLHAGQNLPDVWHSEAHCIIDMGADAFTQGRLHPMLDNDLRLRRLRQEAADPATGLIVLDVVLGEGAHPDPAAELAPAIADVRDARPELAVLCIVVGTDDDPQATGAQIDRLTAAGAIVCRSVHAALEAIAAVTPAAAAPAVANSVMPALQPVGGGDAPRLINVGLESFAASLEGQGARPIHVAWRPPAGGNEALMSILARLKGRR